MVRCARCESKGPSDRQAVIVPASRGAVSSLRVQSEAGVTSGESTGLHWGITSLWRHRRNYSCINTHNFVLAFEIVGGEKMAKFAVCLIFWLKLHARWLDWCQIGSLNGVDFLV